MILLALKNDTIKGPPLLQLCSPGIIELFVCAFTWLCAIILVYNCKCVIALSERAAWQSWLWLCSQTRCASITINETYIANETWWKCGVENLSGFRMQAKGRVLVFFFKSYPVSAWFYSNLRWCLWGRRRQFIPSAAYLLENLWLSEICFAPCFESIRLKR